MNATATVPWKRPLKLIGNQGLLIEYDVPVNVRAHIDEAEHRMIRPAVAQLDNEFGRPDWCMNVNPKYAQSPPILLIGIKFGRLSSYEVADAVITMEHAFDEHWSEFVASV